MKGMVLTMDATVEELEKRVKRSKSFQPGFDPADEGNLAKLLSLFAQKYPGSPTADEIRSVLQRHSNWSVEVGRLSDRLNKCFRSDRSFWPGQKRLFIPRKGKAANSLKVGPLSALLSPRVKFWFSQCVRLESAREHTFIVFSEPLFLYSPDLRAYLRFLDANHEEQFDSGNIDNPIRIARSRIRGLLPKGKQIDAIVARLDLIPTRNYLPAGDSYAAVRIRRWFRRSTKHIVEYKEALDVANDDRRSSLIVLASRSSLKLLDHLQSTIPLEIKLTETGISFKGRMMNDEIGDRGLHLARVVVTNWTFSTGAVHTYIASNHTRALESVASVIASDDSNDDSDDDSNHDSNDPRLQPVSDAILAPDGRIPGRFQLAFEVPLHMNETSAGVPRLLPELDGKAIIYPDDSEGGNRKPAA
jgi:hypothetical protein